MNRIFKLSLLFVTLLTVLLAFPTQAHAQGPSGDQVVFGGTYTLKTNEVLNGNLVIFGGSATLEKDSNVRGDIVITGGSLDAFGVIDGDINTIGGSVYLGDSAVIHGNVISVGGSVNRASGATISGAIRSEQPDNFRLPALPTIPRPSVLAPRNFAGLRPVGKVILGFFQILATSALALLVGLLLAVPTRRAANAITTQPVLSGAIGLLTVVAVPALLLMLAITIILSPVSLLGILVLLAALLFGWIALGAEIGQRLAVMLRTEWDVPISAGLGTLVLSFAAWLISLIPCIGWAIIVLAASIGLGGVVLTRFGARAYVPATPPAAPRPPAPPAQPILPIEPPPAEGSHPGEPGEPLP